MRLHRHWVIAISLMLRLRPCVLISSLGMPFSRWIGHVNPKHHLPVNAILLTAAITILLSAIGFGSSAAFNAILSLSAVGQMGSYSVSITCVLYRRITAPHTLPRADWTLGRFGIPVNAIGAVYAWFAFFWAFWPGTTPVSANSMVSVTTLPASQSWFKLTICARTTQSLCSAACLYLRCCTSCSEQRSTTLGRSPRLRSFSKALTSCRYYGGRHDGEFSVQCAYPAQQSVTPCPSWFRKVDLPKDETCDTLAYLFFNIDQR